MTKYDIYDIYVIFKQKVFEVVAINKEINKIAKMKN